MIRLPWRSSLSFRLSLNLSVVIALFWLVSTGIALWLDLKASQEVQQNQVISKMKDTANVIDKLLIRVNRDVDTLMYRWQILDERPMRKNGYLSAYYIPDVLGAKSNSPRIKRAMDFVEAYGSSGLCDFVDTFVLFDSGIVVSSASKKHIANLKHLEQIKVLRKMPFSSAPIWGKPYTSCEGNWYVIVAKKDVRTGVMIGLTVELPPSFAPDPKKKKSDGMVWLDKEGSPITPNIAILKEPWLGCPAEGRVILDGISVVCQNLPLVGWQLLLPSPLYSINFSSLSGHYSHIVLAFFVLLSLITLLYVTLERTLGRILNNIMHNLSSNVAVAELPPLNIGKRDDELGYIVQAYNRLLTMVKTEHSMLETKIAERTADLEAARHLAEEANTNKTEHLNSISHEIRTPLNGIIGALILLGKSECTKEQREILDTGSKCSLHLLEIINNLLDFSRIESGQMVVNHENIDPLPLIEQAMLTVQLSAMDKGLTLSCLLERSLPKMLYTDGLRVRQILINLLGNAVKFTTKGSIYLQAWSEDRCVYFRVKDTGPGIPAERVDDVFTAFHQLDHYIVGSGLGLPIARSLAEILGGGLFLEVAPRGASFRLELPLEGASELSYEDRGEIVAPERLHDQLRAWGYKPETGSNPLLEADELCYLPDRLRRLLEGGIIQDDPKELEPTSVWVLKILVVDDVETNRDVIGRILRQQGHKVNTASSGHDALVQGKEHIFDLVLMDIRMPTLSGYEVLSLWRDESNGILDPDCPIIALTANAQPGERQRLLDIGFNDYLTKPVSSITLSTILASAANIQLRRGIELELNTEEGAPILGQDPELRERLGADLWFFLMQLKEAQARKNVQDILDALHTIKGLAGQGGLKQIHEAAEHWEWLLSEGLAIPGNTFNALKRLVQHELKM